MLLFLALLGGCVGEAETVDEGCLDALPAVEVLGDEPSALLERANCWRGYLGLAPLKPTTRSQASVVAHQGWLKLHGEHDDRTTMLAEVEGTEGFTGATPFERAIEAGAVAVDVAAGPSAVWGWYVGDAAESLDTQLHHPYLRDALLQPGVIGVGYAELPLDGRRRGYLELVAAVPSGRRTGRPIVFPRDGAEDVPVAWRDRFAGPSDPLFRAEPWGYPVSITVSAQELVPGGWNPYGVSLRSASIRPEGGVPVELATRVPAPGEVGIPLHTTVVLLPTAPLQADTTYVVEAGIDAVGVTWDVATTFRTGAAPPDTDAPVDSPTDDTEAGQPTQR